MKGFNRYLATTALVTLAIGAASSAAAQTSDAAAAPPDTGTSTTAANDQSAGQAIVVTGSRIRSPTITSPSPLQVINSQQIKHEGIINIQDAIQMNPTFGNPGNSRTSSNGSKTGTGMSTIGLRNAGPNLTLVLVDGRRSVPSAPGSSATDIGFIPTGFVDHIDILTGGASAVYGSDAIAGVVNFVYKKHYDGIQANLQTGISQRGDDAETSANVTLGRNFADGRGNAMFYVGWSKQARVSNANRDYTAGGYTSLGTQMRKATRSDDNVEAAKNLFVPVGIYSKTTPAGLFTAGGQNFTVDPDGSGRLATDDDVFNGAPYGALASPLDRFTFATRLNYQVGDHMNVFVQGTYGRTETTAYLNPLGLSSSGGFGVFRDTGYYNIESYVTAPGGSQIKVRNPLVPDAIYNAATDLNGDGLKDISFSKRMSDLGQFVSNTHRDQFQVTLGAEGDLGHKWNYDAYFSYGETTALQKTTGLANEYNFAQSLIAIPDLYDVDKDGNTTEAICADPAARANGCVPSDIYGAGKMSQGAIDYVKADLLRNANQSLLDSGINLSGPLFNLPAGPLELAVGGEFRREASQESWDPLTQAGENGYTQQLDVGGSFTVAEAYTEAQVPLLKNLPLVHSLSVRGAVRISNYSSLSKTFLAYNGGFEYSPVPDIRFRGVYAHAVRAPNISELFRPAETAIDSVADPCLGVTMTSTGTASQICRQDPTVIANIKANGGTFTLNSEDQSGVVTLTRPNPDLREQSASTITFGAVINPTSIHALRNLTITADYYKLMIGHGIGGTNITTAADLCYNQGIQSFCDVITRRTQPEGPYSVGSIGQYLSELRNDGGTRLIEGLDFSLSYLTSLHGLGIDGQLSVQASYSHLLRSYSTPARGGSKRNLKGELGTASDPATVSLSYDNDHFGFTLTERYQPPYFFDQPFRAEYLLADGTPVDKKYFRIPPYIYSDAQFRFNVGHKYQLYLGVKNLTDTRPPGLWGGLPGNNYVYDPFGRRFYAGIRLTL